MSKSLKEMFRESQRRENQRRSAAEDLTLAEQMRIVAKKAFDAGGIAYTAGQTAMWEDLIRVADWATRIANNVDRKGKTK